MEYPKFIKIVEVRSADEANKYLNENWTLLSAGFHQGSDSEDSYHSYSLGLTKEAHNENESKKDNDYKYNLGF